MGENNTPTALWGKKPQNSYSSTVGRATGLQIYYVIADPNVGEQHIYRKIL